MSMNGCETVIRPTERTQGVWSPAVPSFPASGLPVPKAIDPGSESALGWFSAAGKSPKSQTVVLRGCTICLSQQQLTRHPRLPKFGVG